MDRIIMNLDFDWRFHLGEVDVDLKNAHNVSYNSSKAGGQMGPGGKTYFDSEWRRVDLPHDYFAESDFSADNLHSHGYRTRNNAWYRKAFVLDASLEGKQILIDFEGTAVNAEFYFNGSLMARSFSAYTPTTFDVTDRAYCDGRPNILAVHILGFPTEGWWYEGAGIYRHVRLYAKNLLHIAHDGVFGKTILKPGTKNSWTVDVETTLENTAYTPATACVRASLWDGETLVTELTGAPVTCAGDAKTEVHNKLSVSRPERWDVDNPKLYTLKVEVLENGETVDTATERIGFRTFSVDAERGFILNGRQLKLKGTCNHQDHAGVGVAVPDSVQYYRIKRLKEMGTNAYRCSHNLPAKEILAACDELGMIVMDENRRFETREEVLGYVETMVRRDRNHPSVIFYSLFNEEPLQNTEEGARIFRRMKSVVRRLDDTRLVMGAINGTMEGAGMEMDITGINYSIGNIARFHAMHPEQPIFGSENNSAVTTRGCYKTDREGAQVLHNYDEEVVPWGQTVRDTWRFTRANDYFAGIFIWTGFDYRGEPTPFVWPSVSSQFGIMDTCGFAKDSFYYNQACFTEKPMVHLLPHWNWTKGETVRVVAVSNCDEVELFLGGKSLGRKPVDACEPAEWQVEFAPGRLLAKAYRNGKCVAKDEQRTAGKPYAIKIMPDTTVIKNDGHDTAVINFAVVDRHGVIVPTASNLLHFDVTGDGFVRGVGNGDPNSHESDILPERLAYCGLCQALITSKIGAKSISLRAWSEGLEEATLDFTVEETVAPLCPPTVTNYLLGGFTMSAVTDERPDPLMVIEDNDMNSFIPLEIRNTCHQKDFRNGWRIYRATVKASADATYALSFAYARFDGAEMYVNGKQIANEPCGKRINGVYVTDRFEMKAGETYEFRMLMYIKDADEWGAGISDKVEIYQQI